MLNLLLAHSHSSEELLDSFNKSSLKLGALSCFHYFDSYLQSKEELLVSIKIRSPPGTLYSRNSAIVSHSQTLMNEEGPPPASPCASPVPHISKRSNFFAELSNETVGYDAVSSRLWFLIAGYTSYMSPHVWLRKSENSTQDKGITTDSPLRLHSTNEEFESGSIRAWDVAFELVQLNVFPSPPNPFAIDFDCLDKIPRERRIFLQGALSGFLRQLLLTERYQSISELIFQDLEKVTERHFEDLAHIVHIVDS